MKFTKQVLATILITGLAAGILSARADDKKAKPYPLAKCVVSDEKFEGNEMKPYEFVHEGQTIKLCCKSCLKDFKKEPAKYLKKLEEEAKKQKK
jgi:YHS domain-containing protein